MRGVPRYLHGIGGRLLYYGSHEGKVGEYELVDAEKLGEIPRNLPLFKDVGGIREEGRYLDGIYILCKGGNDIAFRGEISPVSSGQRREGTLEDKPVRGLEAVPV